MPRIDPLSLLKCLSVLLAPEGGIKSKDEVQRLANLMTKFSKKLVSKCIYIQILKTTNTDLLSQFMSAGGWNLIHMWLTDGILAKNWALIQELLELLFLCPVDIERLKSNNCPKLIKGLSKEGSHQGVRVLASRLVEQWLKIVKGEAAPNSVPAQIMTVPIQISTSVAQNPVGQPAQQQQQQEQEQQYNSNCGVQQSAETVDSGTVCIQDLQFTQDTTSTVAVTQFQQSTAEEEQQQQQTIEERIPVLQLQVVSKAQPVQIQQQATQQVKKSFVVVTTPSQSPVPVYKITIRDGKQVLTKVETEAANISSVLNTSVEVNGDIGGEDVSAGQEDTAKLSDGADSGQDSAHVDNAQAESTDQLSSEVKEHAISSKDSSSNSSNSSNDAVLETKSKNNKDAKDAVSDSNKSSDKENRDSHKKDEKKSGGSSDKKSSHHHSSSKSSSKHSSSSHRSSSTSHRSSSHRSSSSSSSSASKSSSSKDKSSKDKEKHHSSSKHGSSGKSKSERDKEREKEREKQKKDQAEKDKATLEKVQGQALSSKLGKIPKRKSEDEKPEESGGKKSGDGSKENKEKKVVSVPEKKNISISIENRKNSQDSAPRPKTVKTFNSKFRSTGLEEEVKPPPPRSAKKPNAVAEKKVIPPKLPTLKRPSPLRETTPLAEKKPKLSLDSPTTPPTDEKKGGIKLIPPKPKPMVLQESDMFMDALTASTKNKEPRKRKRRTSITKDGSSEAKKQETANSENHEPTPPPTSPPGADDKSPVVVKPNFKFYQDTLEINEDKEQKKEGDEDTKKEIKEDGSGDQMDDKDIDDGSSTPTPDDDVDDTKASDSPDDAEVLDALKKENCGSFPEIRYVDGLKSVLLLQKRKGPKKSLKWKTDLESIRYFELDETERVNVTKTFTDMKQMEKQNEREAFQMARKLNTEDLMEEKTRWKPLIPIDLPPPLVEPGKDSREKDIQYAREKGILQALYFNRSMIPDSAAEPDEERHHVITDPKVIPLDDLTGNKESEKDFTSMPWPEPKPQLPPQNPPVTNFHYQPFPQNQQPMMQPMGPQTTVGQMPQMPQQMMAPPHMAQMAPEMAGTMPPTSGGGWRTGDGKVVVPDVGMNPMGNMPGGFPQGMEHGPMVPPGMMGPPPMYNQQQEGYMMGPDDMGYNNMPNNFQGPPGPMYGPGPNFQGPRGGGPMHNRGRGGPGPGPGWYRGGGPMGRGAWRGGGWRGSGKQPPICRQFSKNSYCRLGDKCQYLHPGVNCPPF